MTSDRVYVFFYDDCLLRDHQQILCYVSVFRISSGGFMSEIRLFSGINLFQKVNLNLHDAKKKKILYDRGCVNHPKGRKTL